MGKKPSIKIVGHVASGKTTLAGVVAKALKDRGWRVAVVDDDDAQSEALLARCEQALLQKQDSEPLIIEVIQTRHSTTSEAAAMRSVFAAVYPCCEGVHRFEVDGKLRGGWCPIHGSNVP